MFTLTSWKTSQSKHYISRVYYLVRILAILQTKVSWVAQQPSSPAPGRHNISRRCTNEGQSGFPWWNEGRAGKQISRYFKNNGEGAYFQIGRGPPYGLLRIIWKLSRTLVDSSKVRTVPPSHTAIMERLLINHLLMAALEFCKHF